MDVSVVMCVFNQQATVEQAVESVVAQVADFPYEIIIADDCSSDATPAICRRLADKYPDKIRYIRREKNLGIACNYFDAIRRARGKYIADLAGDDIWVYPRKLKIQKAILDSDSSIVLCHSAWKKFDANGNVWTPTECMVPVDDITITEGSLLLPGLLAHRRADYFVHLCASMFRRDAVMHLLDKFPQLLENPALPCEDYQLVCLLATQGKFAALPKTVLHYRVGHSSLSSVEDAGKTARFAAKVIRLTVALTEALGFPPSVIRHYLRHDMQYALAHAVDSRDKETLRMVRSLIRDIKKLSGISLKTRLTLITSRFGFRLRLSLP